MTTLCKLNLDDDFAAYLRNLSAEKTTSRAVLYALHRYRNLSDANAHLTSEVRRLQDRLAAQQQVINQLRDLSARVVELAGQSELEF